MKITRLNADFGNSTNNFLVDSYYFEIPTCVVELTKDQAEGFFTNSVENVNDLLERLLVSTNINDTERFFLVGKLAEGNPYANNHVGSMHDKVTSDIPYVTFLAGMIYQYQNNLHNQEEKKSSKGIEIDSMKMMLPIWLLKKEAKFSIAQEKMAKRFIGEHSVKLLTPGMETEVKINVKQAKCYIESEVGRWSLKYKMLNDTKESVTIIEKRTDSKIFDTTETVLVDIGGGSTDAVLLTKGLNTPISKDSFQVIQIDPFLGRLEQLFKEKLIEYFSDLRSLECFIVENYGSQRYILKNHNTGSKVDLTQPITEMLKEYADILVYKVMDPFSRDSKRTLKYIYFGGEAPILEPYIKEAVKRSTNEEIMENNHYFLSQLMEESKDEIFKPTARTINLAALEILSLNERKTS